MIHPVYLLCIATSLTSLLLAAMALQHHRRLANKVNSLHEKLTELNKEFNVIKRGVLNALKAFEEMDDVKKLKRKRRRRYISAIIIHDYKKSLPKDPRAIQQTIENAVKHLFGERGVAEVKPQVVYYDPVRGAVIIRTNHLAVSILLASLGFIREINGIRAKIIPLRTCGTLQSAKRVLGVLEKLPTRVTV